PPSQSSGNITMPPHPVPSNQTNSTSSSNATTSTTNQTVPPKAPEGLEFPGSNYSLVLDDVSVIPSSSGPCGIFSVRDPSGIILDKLLICPPESDTWRSPEGHLYRIRVDEVAAGYSGGGNWAKVEIFG